MRAMMQILCLSTNIARFGKFLHILPKLWPPIISRQFHGLVKSKMAYNQNIMSNLENLKPFMPIKNIQKIVTIK
jgi:hypothetical protein